MSLSSSLTLLAAVIGWGITHIFSEARERRKELRVQIDKLHELLYQIEKDAINFHCASKFDVEKNGDLITKLSTLERILTRVLDIDRFTRNIILLRRSITLDNFDLTGFTQQARDSDITYGISGACQDFEDAIEQYYQRKYPRNFPYINIFR